MFPVFLMASLPYRIARKIGSHDEEIHLQVRLVLEFCPVSVLALYFYSGHSRPMPGRYRTSEKQYIERDCDASKITELACFTPGEQQLKKTGKSRVYFRKE